MRTIRSILEFIQDVVDTRDSQSVCVAFARVIGDLIADGLFLREMSEDDE